MTAKTDLNDVEDFKGLIVKNDKNAIVRLRDIAKVELGSQNYNSSVTFNGKRAVFIAISPNPDSKSPHCY